MRKHRNHRRRIKLKKMVKKEILRQRKMLRKIPRLIVIMMVPMTS